MKKTFLLLLSIFLILPAYAIDFQYPYEGQTLTYTIISETARTCKTKAGDNVGPGKPGNSVSGDLKIPDVVYYNETEYSVIEIGVRGFRKCTDLTSVEIPNSVTIISSNAFEGCTGLTSIEIPNSVTSINWNAFNACTGLTSVEIPNNVTTIEQYAFGNCSSLKEMIIADGELSINMSRDALSGEYLTKLYLGRNFSISTYGSAFNGMESLTELIIGNSVSEIGESAFYSCTGLTSLEIPNSVKTIGRRAFYSCTGLKSLVIDCSVVGREAFYNCSELSSIEMGDSVKKIDESVFSDCSELSSIVMGNSVTEIGMTAFLRCTALPSIEIPNSVTFIAKNAFLYCSNLKEITVADGESTLEFGDSPFLGVDLTKLYLGRNIVSNNYRQPFSNIASLTDLIIGNTVTEIGEETFRWCTGLKSISIGSSVVQIGEYAFSDCSQIEKLSSTALVAPDFSISTFPGSVRAFCNVGIPEEAYLSYQHKWACFSCFSDITEENDIITVSSPGNLINQMDISKINDITKLKLIGSINGSDMLILNKCINLASLDLSEATIESGGMPYYEADNQQFVSEDNVLGEKWCYNLNSLSFVKLPKNLNKIGYRAFYEKTNLLEIDITDSLIEIGNEAFRYCSNLRFICIPNTVTEIGWGAFYCCVALNSVDIPNSVTAINGAVFYYCKSLTSVNIPNTVTSVGSYAFAECVSLTSIMIPNSVSSIGSEAFNGCNSLTKVISLSQTPPSISPDTFGDTTYSTGTLFVDDNCKNVYWLHPSWGKFTNIEGLGSQVVLIELDPDKWKGKEGDTFQIIATVYPTNASNKTLEWSTSDDSIATVDAEGIVKVLKSGNCVITAKATDDSGVEASCIISVTADFQEIFNDNYETISVYNLGGMKISESVENLPAGIYIIRQGNKVIKIAIK